MVPDHPIADLDHAATTSVRPEVRAAMAPFLDDRFGNPSGSHARAREAMRAVDEARERIAVVLGCAPDEVVFTSGATEADNHAVTGGLPIRSGIPLCSAVEHPAVLHPVHALGGRSVAVDPTGRIDPDALVVALGELGTPGFAGDAIGATEAETVSVVSVMTANNEVGTINDLDAVADIVDRIAPGTPLHTDAAQGAAWLDLAKLASRAQLVSVSGHKVGGPKGVGVLVVRHGTSLEPLIRGGSQEHGRRAGTLNVPGIVGCAAALESTAVRRDETNRRVGALRDRMADGLVAIDGVTETVVGADRDRSHVIPGICHLSIRGVDSEALLYLLDSHGVAASAASSCQSGAQVASHVAAALGVPADAATLRLSLGWDSTGADVDRALEVIPAVVERIRTFAGSVGR